MTAACLWSSVRAANTPITNLLLIQQFLAKVSHKLPTDYNRLHIRILLSPSDPHMPAVDVREQTVNPRHISSSRHNDWMFTQNDGRLPRVNRGYSAHILKSKIRPKA